MKFVNDEKLTKTFTVIGVYDNKEFMNYNNDIFISQIDIDEIAKAPFRSMVRRRRFKSQAFVVVILPIIGHGHLSKIPFRERNRNRADRIIAVIEIWYDWFCCQENSHRFWVVEELCSKYAVKDNIRLLRKLYVEAFT